MSSGKILVTGATGFVGRALVHAAVANGTPLRAAVRNAARAARRFADSRVAFDSIAVGDVRASTDWSAALEGCEVVVHLANLAHATASAAELQEVNVDGTLALAQQACRLGVRRMVFLSSVKALGEASDGRPLRVEDPAAPVDAYGRAKLAAEKALRELASRSALEVTILRPPLVYGAGVRANFLALLRAVARGLPLPLASIRNRRSLVHVGNLSDAILACATAPQAAGRTYHVTDGEPVSTPALARAIGGALGRPARLLPCPPALLEFLAAAVGRGETVKRLTRSLELDDSALRDDLGWQPRITLEAGLRETALWFESMRAGGG